MAKATLSRVVLWRLAARCLFEVQDYECVRPPQVIVPDKWKAGARNTTEGGGRKLNQNKLLSKKK